MSKSIPSNSFAAAVREHFALSQAELGRFLGVTAGQVAHEEAGRRTFSSEVSRRLIMLGWLVSPALGGLGPAGPAEEQSEDAATPAQLQAVAQQLRTCRYRAVVLRRELARHAARNRTRQRRQWAARFLRASLRPPAGLAPLVPTMATLPGRNSAREERWLQQLEADTAAIPTPGVLDRPLLELRLRLLEEEATALEALLSAAGYVPPAGPGA
jgi:transcriptional regulator with XRE-family HTH domain